MALSSRIGLSARRGDAEPTFKGDRVRLDGRYSWVATGPEALLLEIRSSLPGMAERVGSVLLVDFGNAVGRFEIPHLGTVEVVSSKWTESDFDTMLADLSRIAAQLPFAARRGGSLPYDRSLTETKPILYHLFAYLRHVLADDRAGADALGPALAAVVRDPHRRVVRHSRMVSTDRARDLSPSELMALVTGRRPLVPVAAGISRVVAAERLGGCLPEEVRETVVRSSIDTPENRFVKSFLDTVAGVLDRVELVFDREDALCGRIRSDCALLRRRLEPIRRAGMWREVGRLGHFPASSTVLQRRRGYRTVFRCHSLMRLGSRLPLDEAASRRLLEIRDIAELYELWCFFRCVEIVAAHLGRPVEADLLRPGTKALDVQHDYRVRWSDGTAIHYNLRFSRSRPANRQSYSTPLRPDIALAVPSGPAAGLHLFDAKFRLQSIGGALDDESGDDDSDARSSRHVQARGPLQDAHLPRRHPQGTVGSCALSRDRRAVLPDWGVEVGRGGGVAAGAG